MVELAISQQLGWGMSQQLMMAYTYGQDLSAMEALPEIAPMDIRYSLTGSHFAESLHTAIRVRHLLAQKRISESFGERLTLGFTLLDMDANYVISRQVSLKLGAQNLLNQRYYEYLNGPIGLDSVPLFALGRNFFAMVSLMFP